MPVLQNPSIRYACNAAETLTEERCRIAELSNIGDDSEVSIARARVAPGVSTRWHRLRDTRERYVIVSGHGAVELGEQPARTVGVGDVVLIPAGCRQRITALGDEELVFLAICSPRFVWSAYEDIDDGDVDNTA